MDAPEFKGVVTPDTSKEHLHNRDEVIEAFNNAFDRFKGKEGSLDDEMRWHLRATEDARAKTLEARPKKNNLTIEFDNHPADPPRHYKQAEGIPVDGLLKFLEKELEDPGLTDDERNELANQYNVIAESSRAYRHATPRGGRSARMLPGRLVARVAYEANLIASDPNPTMRDKLVDEFRAAYSRDPSDDEVLDLHWYKAIDLIDDRRELVIPARTRITEPPIVDPPVDPPPEDDPPEDPPGDPVEEARYEADVVNFTGLNAERAYTYAQKIVDEKIRGGKLYNVLNWPRAIKYRLLQPHFVYKFQEKLLRGEAIKKGLLTSEETYKRTQKLVEDYQVEETQERIDVRKRFEALAEGTTARGDRVVELKADNPEQQALRAKIVTDILTPICDGTITTQEQVQAKLADFVRANLKDSTTLQEIFGPEANNFGKLARTFATGLLEQGLRIKADREVHGKTMAELDNQIRIRIANAKGLTTDQRGQVAKWIARGERRREYRQADMKYEGRLKGIWGSSLEQTKLAGLVLNPLFLSIGATGLTRASMKALGTTGSLLQWTPFMVGAVVGGAGGFIRRWSETEADFRRHLVERTKGEAALEPKKDNLPKLVRGLRAISGGSTRERLEQIAGRLHTTSVRDLIDGAGVDQITGVERKSIAQFISDGDAEGIKRRKAEIIARQRFNDTDPDVRRDHKGNEKKGRAVDMITYEKGMVQENLRELDMTILQLTNENSTAVDGDADFNRMLGEYKQRMLSDRNEMEKEFRKYRLQRSFIAGGWGTVVGLGGGFIAHGIVRVAGFRDVPDVVGAVVGKAGDAASAVTDKFLVADVPLVSASIGVPLSSEIKVGGIVGKAEALLEHLHLKKAPKVEIPGDAPVEKQQPTGPVNFEGEPNREVVRALYERGGDVKVGENFYLHVNEPNDTTGLARAVSLREKLPDGTFKTLDPGWAFVNKDGHFIVTGARNIDTWPESLRNMAQGNGWEIRNQPVTDVNYNLEQRITTVMRLHQQNKDLPLADRSFRWGRFDITVDANNNTGSNILKFSNPNMGEGYGGTGLEFYATAKPDGSIFFDPKMEANAHLKADQVNAIAGEFKNDRYEVVERTIKGPDIAQPPKIETQTVTDYFKGRNEIQKIQFGASHENATPFIPTNAKGTLGIGADGKELQMYERVFTGPDGKKYLQVDVSQMRSHLIPGTARGVNWDNTVDQYYGRIAQDIHADGRMDNFVVGFQPTEEQVREQSYVLFDQRNHPEMGRGVLNLDLDDPTTKALFNVDANGNRVLNQYGNSYRGCFVSAFHRQQDGSYDALARYAGNENLATVTREIPQPPIPGEGNTVYDIRGPKAFEVVPPAAAGPEVPPVAPPVGGDEGPPVLIPFDWVPRWPLQPMEELLLIYGYGSYSGEGLGWVPREEYERRRSRTLIDDPDATLDEAHEVADYLSRMDPAYKSELERMDATIGAPMSPEARIVITIPTFGEGKIIKATLEHFLNQKDKDGNPINFNLFEIIVFENDTEARPKDDTEEIIRRFNAAHPELKVRYAFRRWTQEDIDNKVNTVGNGRRYNCDLALVRSSKRTGPHDNLIIINNDADLEGISPKYISDVIGEFDANDRLDAVVGKRNLPDWALAKPNIRLGHRLWEVWDSVMRHTGGGESVDPGKRQKGWPGMIGENSAMRASIYAAVGGYGPHASLAEDQNLGDMMRVARNYDDTRFEYKNRLQTFKNPRRYLAYMVGKKPIIDMYNDYHENKTIRDLSNTDLLRRIPDTFSLSRFELDADGIYQQRRNYEHLGTAGFDARFKKVMDFMGAEYRIESGHVKVTNVDRLMRGLSRPIPPTP